jgi:hypothetical protein
MYGNKISKKTCKEAKMISGLRIVSAGRNAAADNIPQDSPLTAESTQALSL